MRRNHYGGYRGRRTGSDILKYLILALAAVIAVLGAVLYLNRDKLTKPGPEVPGHSQEQTGLPQPEQPEQSEPAEPLPEPEPEPEPEEVHMAAVSVTVEQILNGSWNTYLEEQGANALVLNMKPDEGVLGWVSARPEAAQVKANSSLEGINDRLRALNDRDVYTVARLSCFRDERLADIYECCIHSNSGYRWKDFGGIHWVSPASEQVQDYLTALAVELAELGFDEILLDNCGYPKAGSGEMGWIKRGEVYDLNALDVPIAAFLDKVRRAVEPYGVTISVRTDAWTVEQGDDSRTGLTGAVLEEYAQRIWMPEEHTGDPLAEILSLAGVTNVGERLVTQGFALESDASWEQAVLEF